MAGKLTAARRRVLTMLVSAGGKATPYDLAYPRAHMMHDLFMQGLVETEGSTNAFGEPRSSDGGVYVITPAGRTALEDKP